MSWIRIARFIVAFSVFFACMMLYMLYVLGDLYLRFVQVLPERCLVPGCEHHASDAAS